ncbi:DUF1292 domain-containing protein [Caldisalinibacter kiritimatiensis]|uniref:UPF0473 protein L21TH_1993 n=1 Tax=Caldisalinibacter kiritimatiensis TaxID=1304284 RepID=R1CTD7_9FIRM|nr:DUF1292 domain-containing protein [Caldisalinibacter kiritimatiensis]EOC99948.1 hypothetical protein L21TH_1993 [Caldisalinibacter kiritimatiensis]
MKENKNIIELIDDNGNKEEFEVLATFHIEDNEYAILQPYGKDNDEDDGVVVLRIECDESGNLSLVNIEDKNEIEDVIAAYNAIADDII